MDAARSHDAGMLTIDSDSALLRSPSPLFPDMDDRVRIDDQLTRRLRDARERVFVGPVTPKLDIDLFRQELAAINFTQPRSLEVVLEWVVERLETGVVHLDNPRYFGLFNPGPSFPAQCADRIAAVFNPQLATSTTSPVAVELEAHVIRDVARRVGLPAASTGHFTTGGAEANFTALVCALTRACPEFAVGGARAFGGQPTFYVSSDSHLAWVKIAHQSGIGRSAVRMVPTDGRGRLALDALGAAIEVDVRAGNIPVMIAATAGTTSAGMIDPLIECSELARTRNLWYHVDAAWGGAVIVCDKLRALLEGAEQADSITVDAHKWLATTMGCGMFITRDPGILASAFQVSTSYMPSNLTHLDPYVTTVQWSRRFLGLRLFLSLATAGWTGYADHVRHSIALSAHLADELTVRGWAVVNNSPLAVLCLRPPPGSADIRWIVARVLASGNAWISATTFEGHDVIRACVTHGETTRHDVGILVDALEAARRKSA
jgi:glutamate/tyrosine decarboxylase-like PLP-dependent enzyme